MFMVILKRNIELERVKSAAPWVYICGRRKTGKTFFVRNFLEFEEYFFVRKDRGLLDKNSKEVSYETFFELFKEMVGRKRIVIDEFHRLPPNFFEYLHFLGIKGELIIISSTLWFSKRLLGSGSPLLGLFSTVIFSLADERDVIKSLKNNLKRREFIEACIYLREPLLAPKYKSPLEKFLPGFMESNKLSLREIIGEIFEEEERELSVVYEGIMRSIAARKNISTEISSYLFSKKLIKKDNPGYVQRYLDNMVKIGILEKLEVWNKNKFRYFHISPIFDLHFYLDEKYSYVENEVPEKFLRDIIEYKIPFHVEQFCRNLFSKLFGMKKVVIEEPEIDIALTEFKKLKVIGEVKWKKRVGEKEIRKIEEKFERFKNVEKYLIVPEKKILERNPRDIKVLDIEDILKMV